MLVYSLVQMYHDPVYFQSIEGLAHAARESYIYHMNALKLDICDTDADKLKDTYIRSLYISYLKYQGISIYDKWPVVTIQLDHGWFTVQEIVVND